VGLTTDDDDSNDSEKDMAECGACRAVIPIDSTSCPSCNVSFAGVAEEEMGECGGCHTILPMDSKSCPQCGVTFVMDDLTTALSSWMKDESLTISELFGEIDADGDDSLTSDEIKSALLERDLAFLGTNELDRFLTQIDLNHDGVISFAELAAALSMPWTPPEEMTVLEPEEGDEVDDSDEEEDEDDDDSDEEEDEDDDDSDEEEGDGIEIGSRVGVEDEDGDWYGEVVEFDDEADTVVVKREDDGDEYEVEWDALFQDD